VRAVVLALVAGAALLACGEEEGDRVFDEEGFPFTFSYPDGFEETGEVTVDQSLGSEADDSIAIGVGENDGIIVQRYELQIAVDESNLDQAQAEFDSLIGQVDPKAGSRTTEIAGLPALEFDAVDVPSIEGAESRFTVLFQGDQEYLINCQSTPEHRETVESACDEALDTLELK
jgi:hypothetical protein